MSVLVYAVGCCGVESAVSQYVRYVEGNPSARLQVNVAADRSKLVIVDCASQCDMARVGNVVEVADAGSSPDSSCAGRLC